MIGLNAEADLAVSLANALYQHALEARLVDCGGERKVSDGIGTSQDRQQAKAPEKRPRII
jgi:hypothetical protein